MAKTSKKDDSQVVINCLKQNCYVRCVTPLAVKSQSDKVGSYYELQEKQFPNGFCYELVECDYPITKESVKSYESSTNYKTDLDGALRTNKKNLGDITQVQQLMQDDARKFFETYNRVAAQLAEYQASQNANNQGQSEVKSDESTL